MKTENMYLVWAHPRTNSLTAHIVKAIQEEAAHQSVAVTTLDLYRRGFNPVLGTEDEPDWSHPKKQYSAEVHQLFDEMAGRDTAVIVFPVWWYSFPAMIKGYLDRVWNYGLVYGEGGRIPVSRVRWVALVGGAQDKFEHYGWQKNMTDYLKKSMSYLGVEDTEVTFLYNTVGIEDKPGDSDHYESLFRQVKEMVKNLRVSS